MAAKRMSHLSYIMKGLKRDVALKEIAAELHFPVSVLHNTHAEKLAFIGNTFSPAVSQLCSNFLHKPWSCWFMKDTGLSVGDNTQFGQVHRIKW